MAGEFKFPDEQDETVVVSQQEDGDVEIEIVDDTPERDKGRTPLDREVADPTDAEIETYTKGAQERIKELTHARHDERRAKEALQREKQELERLAQHMQSENQKLNSMWTPAPNSMGRWLNKLLKPSWTKPAAITK
jgi:chromosome segregation ATPase